MSTTDELWNRKEAIRRLASDDARMLTNAQKAEILETAELWEGSDSQSRENACSVLSLEVLLTRHCEQSWLGASNEYLANELIRREIAIVEIVGAEPNLTPCPCCGFRTLTNPRQGWEICRVCWWEDDGHDNEQADRRSEVNRTSLTQARWNYLTHGIYDPTRADLRDFQEPHEKFLVGRTFVVDSHGVFEPETGWASGLDAGQL